MRPTITNNQAARDEIAAQMAEYEKKKGKVKTQPIRQVKDLKLTPQQRARLEGLK